MDWIHKHFGDACDEIDRELKRSDLPIRAADLTITDVGTNPAEKVHMSNERQRCLATGSLDCKGEHLTLWPWRHGES
jgi:hypothetical protein